MISRRWRVHLMYFALSAFLAWHTIAMLLAPVPNNNATVGAFRSLFQPYLTFIGLDNSWDFFSPMGVGYQFRYVITDAVGKEHTFVPIEQFAWFQPTHRWHEKIYDQLMYEPDIYSDYHATFFCRKHADLNPISIRLLARQEEVYWPENYLAGKNRFGDDYVILNVLKQFACQRGGQPAVEIRGAVPDAPPATR